MQQINTWLYRSNIHFAIDEDLIHIGVVISPDQFETIKKQFNLTSRMDGNAEIIEWITPKVNFCIIRGV